MAKRPAHNYNLDGPSGDSYQEHLRGIAGNTKAPAPPGPSDPGRVPPDAATPRGSRFKNNMPARKGK